MTARTQYEDKKGKVVRRIDPTAPTKEQTRARLLKRAAARARVEAAAPRIEKLRTIAPPTRVIAKCPGLPRKSKSLAARPCGKLVRVTLGQGRPWTRCGECRVLDVWRKHFLREDPASVAKVIGRLAAKGMIGGPRVG